jgi:hypothetical protein
MVWLGSTALLTAKQPMSLSNVKHASRGVRDKSVTTKRRELRNRAGHH